MKKLYNFCHDDSCWADYITGMFIEEEDTINAAIGKTLLFRFGPCDEEWIEIKFDECHLTEVDVSAATLEELDKIFNGHLCGHNPLDYIIED